VLENKKAFDAIVSSSTMALDNMGITFKLYITLILVYVRTVLTVLVFILLPFVISAIFTYVTVASIKLIFVGILLLIILVFFVSMLAYFRNIERWGLGGIIPIALNLKISKR
jgi:hypothetical protein